MQNAQVRVSRGMSHFAKIAATRLTPKRVKQFRERNALSQQQFADLFRWSRMSKPYTRNYISMLERGCFPITRAFEKEFYRVRAELRATLRLRSASTDSHDVARETEIIAHFAMPLRFQILAAPRKCERVHCAVCKANKTKYFIPRTPNQVRHVVNVK